MKRYFSLILGIILLPACGAAPLPAPPEPEPEIVAEATTEAMALTDFSIYTTGEGPQTTASGLKYIILEAGDGPSPQLGEAVEVHYTASLTDGRQFDSSYERGQPILFTLGTGEVIPGWDEGMGLLKVGGKARLILPPELGYGERGSGSVIPPQATLYLDVELISIQPGFVAPAQVFAADYTISQSGLKYYDFEPGSGRSPQPGQTVTVHYTGWFEDESMFDSSRLRAQSFSFVLGEGQVIAGWEEGVASMKVGGKRQLVVPPALAYGQAGAGGGAIPPNTTLIFEVELLAID